MLAFSFGGPVWPWNDARFVALGVLSVVPLITFAITQRYAIFTNKTDRLFPCDLLKNFQLFLLWIAIACGGAGLFVAISYFTLYFCSCTGRVTQKQLFGCYHLSASTTSILVAGYAIPRTGYHDFWYLGSGILLTAGGACSKLTVQ